MSKSVIIFGCGYIGLEFARACLEKGWSVTAFTRNSETAKSAEDLGAHAVTGTLESEEWWDKIPCRFNYVVNSVGASSPTISGYRQSYLQGMQSIHQWIHKGDGSLETVVFTSSSSVYPQTDGCLVSEDSPTSGASERAQILLAAEEICLREFLPFSPSCKVIRFSGLYGPGRHLLVDKIRRMEPMSGSPNRYLNLLHRKDAVSAILSVLKAPRGAEIYNACDGQHATRGQIAQWVAERLGVREPKFLDPTNDQGPNRRVNNFKLKNELGWMPKYPDFQSGYEDFLASGSG